jgi:hypothetical protein
MSWLLDTGGKFHCTENWRLLQDTVQYSGHLPQLLLADGTRAGLFEQGWVRTELFNIPDVNYSPRLRMNIISLFKLQYDHGLTTVFRHNRCDVVDDKSGLVVGSARLRDGRYVFDHLLIGQVSHNNVLHSFQITSHSNFLKSPKISSLTKVMKRITK